MITDNKSIAIVGGGPGGLTLARLLQVNGINVKVYERDFNRDVRVQGATLDLHEDSGLEALRRAGLIEAFKANYRPGAEKIRILDKHANIKYDDHSSEGLGDIRPEIDRGPLRNILLDSLLPDTVIWDCHFQSLEKKGEGWQVNFKNGTSYYADIVIAADGANSKIRPIISDIKPIYSGITIVEGTVYHSEKNARRLHQILKGGKVFAFGDDHSLILSSKGDGSLSFYTGCKVDEDWVKNSEIDFNNKEQVFAWFKETFGKWDSVWQELFASDEVTFAPRPQYHFPLDQQWKTLPNITMLGDAAHRMPPYAGEGVNMAMQDAIELAECLADKGYESIQEALSSYEKQMLKRASEVTEITLLSTEMLHSGDPISSLIKLLVENK